MKPAPPVTITRIGIPVVWRDTGPAENEQGMAVADYLVSTFSIVRVRVLTWL